jgi:branched-chain amino acid transport system substrate-binding protein
MPKSTAVPSDCRISAPAPVATTWGSPFYYATLQALTRAIEAVGSMDRMAIADYLRKNKFKTIVGDISMPDQIIDKNYTVGQWQGGFFQAVAGVGFGNLAQAKLKTGWA